MKQKNEKFEEFTKDLNTLLKKVEYYYNSKRFEEILTLLTDDIIPKYLNNELFFYKGLACGQLNKYSESIKYFNESIKTDPVPHKYYYNLAISYYNINDYENAKYYFEKTNNLANSLNYLGIIYSTKKDFEKSRYYFNEAIKVDPKYSHPYYNLCSLITESPPSELDFLNEDLIKKYLKDIISYLEKYLEVEEDKNCREYKSSCHKLSEYKILFEDFNCYMFYFHLRKIKKILLSEAQSISHYTSLSTSQYLIFKDSSLRISEGNSLNDTSEGSQFLDFLGKNILNLNSRSEMFFTKPFILSFVDSKNDDDLSLWRFYGKEDLEEAKGCCITINKDGFIKCLSNKILPNNNVLESNFEDYNFFNVAYFDGHQFDFTGSTKTSKKELNLSIKEIKKLINTYLSIKNSNLEHTVFLIKYINQISYLFKNEQYKNEKEVRLVINDPIGFEIKVDFNQENFIPSKRASRVYLELIPITENIQSITIGPKVERANEWAAAFYYHLMNKQKKVNIKISKLPYK